MTKCDPEVSALLQQALDFITATNASSQFWLVPGSELNKTVTALRARLAEPVACHKRRNDECACVRKAVLCDGIGPEPEPVAVGYWDGKFSDSGAAILYEVPQKSAFGFKYRNAPLYTAPPTRRPLTDSEADALAHEMVKGGKSAQWLVRAIERAHNITGGNDD